MTFAVCSWLLQFAHDLHQPQDEQETDIVAATLGVKICYYSIIRKHIDGDFFRNIANGHNLNFFISHHKMEN